MTSLTRSIALMQAAGHDWVPVPISTLKGLMMTTKTVGKVKLTEKDGKARRIAKSKSKRVVAPAKARAAK